MVFLSVFFLGCSSLGYYGQAVWGQTKILAQRRAIDKLIADPGTPAELRAKLRAVERIRAFATTELALPADGSFRSYVELEPAPDGGRRLAVVWNVVAAPELSTLPVTWCFPVVGCVAYRGYFSERRARRFAARLERKGLDVTVAGAAAYSTLGFFDDPVLSTVIDYPETALAGLLFHELAHQVVFVKGDTVFNESFATAVENEGVRRWLRATDRSPVAMADYLDRQRRRRELTGLYLAYRDRLAAVYRRDREESWKRARKREIFDELCARLDLERGSVADECRLNNADLAAVASYHDLVPAFEVLLGRHGRDLESFYAAVAELAELDPDERRRRLEPLVTPPGVGSLGR